MQKDLTLDLGSENKETEGDVIWSLINLENVIAKLDIIAELEWVDTSFEARWVVTALGREKACEMSNVLLLELEKDMKKEKRLFSFLYTFC